MQIVTAVPCLGPNINEIIPSKFGKPKEKSSCPADTRPVRSFDDVAAKQTDKLLEILGEIIESSNERLSSVSAELYGILALINESSGTINVNESFDKITELSSSSDILEDLPETGNNFIVDIRDNLNVFSSVKSTGSESSIDSALANVLLCLLKYIDAIDSMTAIANAVSDEITEEIATEIVALSLVLSTVLCIVQIVLVKIQSSAGLIIRDLNS